MTLEQRYTQELKELGVYKTAFDGTVKLLAQMERELGRIDKAWREACAAQYGKDDAGRPKKLDYCHELHEKMEKARRDILTYRESLGLTPKGYKRLRPDAGAADNPSDPTGDALAKLESLCREFDG